jgi:hypothetical protein
VLAEESFAPGIEAAAQARGAWTKTVTLEDAKATAQSG